MKQKRDAGVTTTRSRPSAGGAGASSSSSSGNKSRKVGKDVGREKKPRACRTDNNDARMHNLTAVRMAHIIKQLDNKRGSTMESIRGKLIRNGFKTNTCLVRTALERAVKSGLLREIREERFSLPCQRSSSNVNSSTTASSRTSVKTARKVASKGQHPRKLSGSSPRLARRRQRRPPQGRRPANNSEIGEDDDDEGRDVHDDDDTGVGEGDVEAESNGSMTKNPTGSRMSVAEPVAGCDAIMVFGTH
ncbi:hypothetical protein ACOMHN_044259 [Nucella lapillus]